MAVKKNIAPKNELLKVYRNEAFDIGFYDYFKDLPNNKISQVLNNRERKITLNSVTYRQINSWEEQGLLTIERENREWRKYSLMDAIWVKILQELREFGFSIDKIRATKESLSFLSDKCGVPMPFLEFYTAFALGGKMPVVILFFTDGVAVPANFTQFKVTKEVFDVDHHIQINLKKILQGFFPNLDLWPKYELEMPVSIEEVELLAFMRVKQFEKVEVHYKGGRIDLIEGLERVDAQKRIMDIFREQKYSDINLIQQDGRIVAVTRKVKKKIKGTTHPE